jgi:hypothetical protein
LRYFKVAFKFVDGVVGLLTNDLSINLLHRGNLDETTLQLFRRILHLEISLTIKPFGLSKANALLIT